MKIVEVVNPGVQLNSAVYKRVKFIDEKCAPFIKSVGGWEKWMNLNEERHGLQLHRGMKITQDEGVKKVRVNRKAKDTADDLHKFTDEWFLRNKGHRFRSNAVFATSNVSMARHYGHVFTIFPMGQFKTCWSDTIVDLWDTIEDIDAEDDAEMRDMLADALVDGDYQVNAPMIDILESQHEVMIACKEYYYVPAQWLHDMEGPFWSTVSDMIDEGMIQ